MTQKELSVAALKESPLNARRDYGEMKEMTASVRKAGILQPLLVRPVGSGHEIVCGHRRFRAAKAAGLKTVPCFIRELNDREASEAQLVENGQRKDMHPLEEAQVFLALYVEHKIPVEEIAAKVAKTPGHIYARLKLCELSTAGKKEFLAGRLTTATALMIARIPHKDLQDRATKEIAHPQYGNGDPMEARDASFHIQRHYMLFLGEAGFNTKDKDLVPAAGACTNCPKRTRNAPTLFADVGKEDLCTDPVCFRSKRDAAYELVKLEAKEKGHLVASAAEEKKLFPTALHTNASGVALEHDSPYVELSARHERDPKARTWGQLLGKKAPPVMIARDPTGRVRELVKKSDADSALRKAGVTLVTPEGGRASSDQAKHRATIERQKRENEFWQAVGDSALEIIAARVELEGMNDVRWRLLVADLLESGGGAYGAARRRKMDMPQLHEAVGTMTEPKLRGLAMEIVVENAGDGAATKEFKAVCALFALDVSEVRNRVKKQREAKEKAAKAPKAKAPDGTEGNAMNPLGPTP